MSLSSGQYQRSRFPAIYSLVLYGQALGSTLLVGAAGYDSRPVDNRDPPGLRGRTYLAVQHLSWRPSRRMTRPVQNAKGSGGGGRSLELCEGRYPFVIESRESQRGREPHCRPALRYGATSALVSCGGGAERQGAKQRAAATHAPRPTNAKTPAASATGARVSPSRRVCDRIIWLPKRNPFQT
jgi:hypothetical protein